MAEGNFCAKGRTGAGQTFTDSVFVESGSIRTCVGRVGMRKFTNREFSTDNAGYAWPIVIPDHDSSTTPPHF